MRLNSASTLFSKDRLRIPASRPPEYRSGRAFAPSAGESLSASAQIRPPGGALKVGNLEETMICHLSFSRHQREEDSDGESTQNGHHRHHSYAAPAALVRPADRQDPRHPS